MRSGYRSDRRQRGVAAVEFGLLLPVLMMILLGIMEYGYIYYVHLNMTNAAREGARVGVVQETGPAAAAQSTTQAYLTTANVAGGASVSATLSGDNLQVIVTKNYTPLIGFVPTPSSLTARATMRWELAPTP